ncbi:MAG: phosphotransferase enzyme family protein [Candidatus Hodarchaeales archaeon]|jgi:Ser/Thr protein kinase RdoA (MazF antagonist)
MVGQPLYRVTKDHFFQAGQRYGIKPEDLKFVGHFENFVYEYRKNNLDHVLRFGHSSHKTTDQIEAEIDWITYLNARKVPACTPIKSNNGNLVEVIDIDGNSYLNVVAFEKASGGHLDSQNPDKWPIEVIFQWGKITGRMHALAKKYNPGKNQRKAFLENKRLNPANYIPQDQGDVIQVIEDVISDLYSLPMEHDSYGLIHSDFHEENFYVDNVKMTIFDFDDSCYKWFISDIAVIIYYPLYKSRLVTNQKHQKEFIEYFLPIFWNGYCSENRLGEEWTSRIQQFIKLRDAHLYININEMMVYEKFREQHEYRLEGIKKRLLGEISYTPIDFNFS